MCIGKSKKTVIGIKVDEDLKIKIETKANEQSQNISEYIRELTENDITSNDIAKNQNYLYKVLDIIIKNILDEKLNKYDEVIKAMYIKQELIIFLVKEAGFARQDYDLLIKKFYESYSGDETLTKLS